MRHLRLLQTAPDRDFKRRARPVRRPFACSVALVVLGLGAAPATAQVEGGDEGTATEGGAAPVVTEPGSTEAAPDRQSAAQGSITIEADRSRIRIGQSVTFRGERRPAARGDRVNLMYRPAGGDWRTVASTTTDAQGAYRVADEPRRSGAFVVTSPRGSLRSEREGVSVRAEVAVSARRHQLRSRGVRVRGSVSPRLGGRRVILEHQTGKGWERVEATTTGPDGSYRLRWAPPGLGRFALRASFGGDEANHGDRTALEHPVHVYRSDHASYYGPGFYGNTTACGQTLERGTVGVAHKRISCGTRVRFHYRGMSRRIPVIDRGPYITGRRWDLTNAARRKLDFPKGVDEVWANR